MAKCNVLLVTDALIPTFLIGIVRPLIELNNRSKISFRLVRPSNISSQQCEWADVAVFCRSQDIRSYLAFRTLKSAGVPVIYDIDDNFFEFPKKHPLSSYHRSPFSIRILEQFIKSADLVNVYSEELKTKALRYNENVNFIKCYFDFSILEGIEKKAEGRLKIAFATTRVDDPELERTLEAALERIMIEYKGDVELHFWRKPFTCLENMEGVVFNSPLANYEEFVRRFYQTGYDIGLAPLGESVFYNSKTNNKYREYSGCGVAGVYSNTTLYQQCVVPSVNGMLAFNTVDSWYDNIKALIEDRRLRLKICENAHEDICLNYRFESAVQYWEDILTTLSKQKVSKGNGACHKEFSSRVDLVVINGGKHIGDKTKQALFEDGIHGAFHLVENAASTVHKMDKSMAKGLASYLILSGDIENDKACFNNICEIFDYIVIDALTYEGFSELSQLFDNMDPSKQVLVLLPQRCEFVNFDNVSVLFESDKDQFKLDDPDTSKHLYSGVVLWLVNSRERGAFLNGTVQSSIPTDIKLYSIPLLHRRGLRYVFYKSVKFLRDLMRGVKYAEDTLFPLWRDVVLSKLRFAYFVTHSFLSRLKYKVYMKYSFYKINRFKRL